MCACVHLDVIRQRIEALLPQPTCSAIDMLNHTFTGALLAELEASLGGNYVFQQWLLALNARKKMRVLRSTVGGNLGFPPAHPYLNYFIASFYGHQQHVLLDEAALHPDVRNVFQRYGVSLHAPAAIQALRCDCNPVYALTLTNQTRHSPASLSGYFAQEQKVMVYDKHLNAISAAVLAHLAPALADNARVTIMTHVNNVAVGGQQCMDAMLAAKGDLQISVLAADNATAGEIHDRHIFLGKRYDIRFSAGIDVFGNQLGGTFRNSEGAINVLDVWESDRPLILVDAAGQRHIQLVSNNG